MSAPDSLPEAPSTVVDRAGVPAFGTYEGPFSIVDLRTLRPTFAKGPIGRLRHHKKWVYTYAADEAVSVLCAIVDTSYAATAFVAVTDMRTMESVVDRSVMGAPGPLVRVSDQPAFGLDASFRSPLGSFRFARPAGLDHYRLTVDSTPATESLAAAARPVTRAAEAALGVVPVVGDRLAGWVPGGGGASGRMARGSASYGPAVDDAESGRVHVDLRFEAGRTPPLSVVAPVTEGGGSVNVTQKLAGLPVTGSVTAVGRTWQLDRAVGGMDYTHGYLARHTAWNWAFMVGRLPDGTRLGLNLVAGFNETRPDVNENALWVDDRLIPLDRARFAWDRSDPQAAWRVTTVDGSVDLAFTPYAVHSERKDLVVVVSRFIQPIGVFSGTVRIDDVDVAVTAMPGVTEDQDIRW